MSDTLFGLPIVESTELDGVEPPTLGRYYYPSNGWEGGDFQERWCVPCKNDANNDCRILTASYMGPVVQWVYGEDGTPKCTAFEVDHE